jgi:EAL domain
VAVNSESSSSPSASKFLDRTESSISWAGTARYGKSPGTDSQRFISEVTTNAADASIVRAIISLAHCLRLKVVTEGVETAEQLALLRELGSREIRRSGYIPHRPDGRART